MSEFSEKELERVIRKIKHCLALSSSCNEYEAARALRQAQALMRKYRLTETDVNLSDVGRTEGERALANRPPWDRALSSIVAQAFHCQPYDQSYWCRTTLKKLHRAVFIGITPAPEIAKYAYDTLLVKLMAARRVHIENINAGRLPRERFTPETRGNHFAMAWVCVIHDKLTALVPEVEQELEPGERQALLVVEAKDNELINTFVMHMTDGAGPAAARKIRPAKASKADLILGALAGHATELHQGLTTAGEETLAIGAEDVNRGE